MSKIAALVSKRRKPARTIGWSSTRRIFTYTSVFHRTVSPTLAVPVHAPIICLRINMAVNETMIAMSRLLSEECHECDKPSDITNDSDVPAFRPFHHEVARTG